MTRETKIGLLVGLAFIIVIGILLSDYNRNEATNASLPQVADNVRNSTATMHNGSNQNEIVPPPAPAVPRRTVESAQELHHDTVVNGGPGPAPTPSPTLAARTDEHTPIDPVPPARPDLPEYPPSSPARESTDPVGPTGIPGTVTYNPHGAVSPVQPAPPVAPAPTVNGARQYVAIEGDTLNKLAGRLLGGNTKANREAIQAINPSLKANPNALIVGHTYMIPPAKPATASASAAPVTAAPVRAAPVTAAPVTPAPAPAHRTYIVKANDSLWKIASEQLGDSNVSEKVEEIKELNAAILKGGDALHPNMQLRLPAKTVASTN